MKFSSQVTKSSCIIYVLLGLIFIFCIYASYRHGLSTKESYRRTKNKVPLKLLKYDGPLSALNSKSAFYGMIHRDTYGLPLNAWEKWTPSNINERWKIFFPELANPLRFVKFDKPEEEWKILFPKLTKALKMYKKLNPMKNPLFFTKSLLVNRNRFKLPYRVGEEFFSVIYSLDKNGQKKRFGGDYFRARIVKTTSSLKSYPDGIPCRVTDNEDGSYTIRAPLFFEGRFKLDLTLVMSLEAIEKSLSAAKARSSFDHSYLAQFENGESTACDIHQEKMFAQCDYSNPRNREPWFCSKPIFGICFPIVNIAYNGDGPTDFTKFTSICNDTCCQVSIIVKPQINVLASHSSNKTVENIRSKLPKCKQTFESFIVQSLKGFTLT